MKLLLSDGSTFDVSECSVRRFSVHGTIEMHFRSNNDVLIVNMSERSFRQLGLSCSLVLQGKHTNSTFKPE